MIENDDKQAIIIDPADNAEKIIEFCQNLHVVEILVTHHHFDHIGALAEIEKYYKLEHNIFYSSIFAYEVIKTPGHTDDSLSFYFRKENILFDGDFIFKGSIGRFDFPNSNALDMQKSLEMISKFDDNMLIFPGHGSKTYLKNEKKHFKYFF